MKDDGMCMQKGCEYSAAKNSPFCEILHHNDPPAELPGSSLNANTKQIGGTYYQTPIQPWDFIVANDLGFLEGNAIKYIARHRKKNGREDLEKAIHYLQKALEVFYPKT